MRKTHYIFPAITGIVYSILLIVILMIISCIVINGCTDNFKVKTDFDFEVELLPVPSAIKINEQAEMRFTIVGVGGSYDSAKYYLRYFQYSGRGTLADEAGQTFVPNDSYLLPKKQFRLYFTAAAGSQHQLELTFYDNFNHRHPVELTFGIEQEE